MSLRIYSSRSLQSWYFLLRSFPRQICTVILRSQSQNVPLPCWTSINAPTTLLAWIVSQWSSIYTRKAVLALNLRFQWFSPRFKGINSTTNHVYKPTIHISSLPIVSSGKSYQPKIVFSLEVETSAGTYITAVQLNILRQYNGLLRHFRE